MKKLAKQTLIDLVTATKGQIKDRFQEGYDNLRNDLIPELVKKFDWAKTYDVFGGHRSDARGTGKSYWTFLDSRDRETDVINNFLSSSRIVETRELDDGAVGVIFHHIATGDYGTNVTSRPTGNCKVVVGKHGDLNVQGPHSLDESETHCWTAVFTPDLGEDGYCLASIYPGLPDSLPDVNDLQAGDILSPDEVIRRGFAHIL